MSQPGTQWNSPPGWPEPPPGWEPPQGWQPDPAWPPAPAGWQFWVTPAAAPWERQAAAPWERRAEPLDNTWAWALVAVPVLFVALDTVLYLSGVNDTFGIGLVAGLVVNTCLVLADQAALKRAGLSVSLLWGLLFVPVYLFQRAKAAGRSQAMLAAWLAAALLGVAGSLAVERAIGIVYLDMEFIEGAVADDAEAAYGGPQEVTCPSEDTYRVNDRFSCDVTDAEGTAQWIVTVMDADGYVTWEPGE